MTNPCVKCIVLPMCKAEAIKETSLMSLTNKCSILNNYIYYAKERVGNIRYSKQGIYEDMKEFYGLPSMYIETKITGVR